MGYRTRLIVLATGLAIVFIFAGIQFYLSKNQKTVTGIETPSLIREKVSRGEVLLSLKTSGVVDSDNDILLRSPERSIVKQVYVDPGSKVMKGDLLVELEEKSILSEIDRINSQLELKQNALEKYQLNEENTRLSLTQSEEVKKNRLATLKTSLMQQEQALKDGGIDKARVERTRNEIDLAETDLQNLIEKNAIRLKQMDTDKRGLLLQISSQKDDLAAKKRLLQNLKITAPVPGVVQEISVQKGERVESEQFLLRISDFSTFKITGWANISQNGLIATGNSATVKVGDITLHGTVGEITQMYDDQMVRFDVHLEEKHQPDLEVNSSAAVEVISARRENVLRIKKQAGVENTTHQIVYLIKGKEGVKTDLILGTIGNEWCEVVSGVNEGDEIMVPENDLPNSPLSIQIK